MDLKETLELIDAIKNLIDEIEIASQDGELGVWEVLGKYPEVMSVLQEGKDFKAITEELGDLDAEEIKLLVGKLVDIVFGLIKIVKNLQKED